MAGVVFDDLDYVDPNTSLLLPFREWVDILAARRSPATAASESARTSGHRRCSRRTPASSR